MEEIQTQTQAGLSGPLAGRQKGLSLDFLFGITKENGRDDSLTFLDIIEAFVLRHVKASAPDAPGTSEGESLLLEYLAHIGCVKPEADVGWAQYYIIFSLHQNFFQVLESIRRVLLDSFGFGPQEVGKVFIYFPSLSSNVRLISSPTCASEKENKFWFAVENDLKIYGSVPGIIEQCDRCFLVIDNNPLLESEADPDSSSVNLPQSATNLNDLECLWQLSCIDSSKLWIVSSACPTGNSTFPADAYPDTLLTSIIPVLSRFLVTDMLEFMHNENEAKENELILQVYKRYDNMKHFKHMLNTCISEWVAIFYVDALKNVTSVLNTGGGTREGELSINDLILQLEAVVTSLVQYAAFLQNLGGSDDSVSSQGRYDDIAISLFEDGIRVFDDCKDMNGEFSNNSVEGVTEQYIHLQLAKQILVFAYCKHNSDVNLPMLQMAITSGRRLLKLDTISKNNWIKIGLILGRNLLFQAQIFIVQKLAENALESVDEAVNVYRDLYEAFKREPGLFNNDLKSNVDNYVKSLILAARFKGKSDMKLSVEYLFEAADVIHNNLESFSNDFIVREARRLAQICERLNDSAMAAVWYKKCLEFNGNFLKFSRFSRGESADNSSVSASSSSAAVECIDIPHLHSERMDNQNERVVHVDLDKIETEKTEAIAEDLASVSEHLLRLYYLDNGGKSDKDTSNQIDWKSNLQLTEIAETSSAALQLDIRVYGNAHEKVKDDMYFLAEVESLRGNIARAKILRGNCRLIELGPVLKKFRGQGGALNSLRNYHIENEEKRLMKLTKRLPFENNYDEVADCLKLLGDLTLATGYKRKATSYFEEAVKIRRKIKNPETDRNLLLEMRELMGLMWEQNMFQEVEPYHRETVKIIRTLYSQAENDFGENTLHVIKALNDYGLVCFKLEEFDQSQRLFNEAVDIGRKYIKQESTKDSNSLNGESKKVQKFVIKVLKNLARLHTADERPEAALDLYLEIKNLVTTLGTNTFDNQDLVDCLVDLAMAQAKMADEIVPRSYTFTEDGISAQANTGNDSNGDIASNSNQSGEDGYVVELEHRRSQLLAYAQSNCIESIELLKAIHGPRHQLVAAQLSNLANILIKRDEIEQAELVMNKALEIDRSVFGSMHPEVRKDRTRLHTLKSMKSSPNDEGIESEDDENSDSDDIESDTSSDFSDNYSHADESDIESSNTEASDVSSTDVSRLSKGISNQNPGLPEVSHLELEHEYNKPFADTQPIAPMEMDRDDKYMGTDNGRTEKSSCCKCLGL